MNKNNSVINFINNVKNLDTTDPLLENKIDKLINKYYRLDSNLELNLPLSNLINKTIDRHDKLLINTQVDIPNDYSSYSRVVQRSM